MEKENLWLQVLEELKVSVSQPIFQTLLLKTTLVNLEKEVATIACPNPYIQSLVESRYYALLKNTLDKKTGQNNSLIFIIRNMAKEKSKVNTGPLFSWQEEKTAPKTFDEQSGLNPRYTFDTFVVGNSNNFAHAAAQAIVQAPGSAYNPFFVWGGVGVGKTHLVQAIGWALKEKNKDFKLLYISSETFTNDLVSALQQKKISVFKNKYRSVDALLVDDIQFIAGKEYSQEEFFHTFNALYVSGRQIILTSDRKPEEIPKIEERLTSRFMGGLTVDIQAPDYEMRVAILKARCRQLNATLGEKVIEALAENTASNVRELEGILAQVLASAKASGVEPNLDFVNQFFGIKNKKQVQDLAPRSVIAAVASHFKIKTGELLGPCRRKELVVPRQITMYLLRKELELSLVKVGELIGGRDHTTIIHGVDKIGKRFSLDSQLRHEIMLIKEALQS